MKGDRRNFVDPREEMSTGGRRAGMMGLVMEAWSAWPDGGCVDE